MGTRRTKRRICSGRYAPEDCAGTGKKGAMPEPVVEGIVSG